MVFLDGLSDYQMTGEDAWFYIFRRHYSYFATDGDSLKGLFRHLGDDDEWFGSFLLIVNNFNETDELRESFQHRHWVDANSKNLIGKITNLDPSRWITAREALEHPWFQDTTPGNERSG